MGGKHTLGLLCHQAYRTLIRVCGHKRVCIIHACAIVQCSKQKSLFQNIFYLQGRLQVQTCSANNPRFLMYRLPQSSKLLNIFFYLQGIHWCCDNCVNRHPYQFCGGSNFLCQCVIWIRLLRNFSFPSDSFILLCCICRLTSTLSLTNHGTIYVYAAMQW